MSELFAVVAAASVGGGGAAYAVDGERWALVAMIFGVFLFILLKLDYEFERLREPVARERKGA